MTPHRPTQKPGGEAGDAQDRAPLPAGSRLALAASLPGLIMLLVGFVVAVLIGVRKIGVWPTVILWCAILALWAAAVVLALRLRKRRGG